MKTTKDKMTSHEMAENLRTVVAGIRLNKPWGNTMTPYLLASLLGMRMEIKGSRETVDTDDVERLADLLDHPTCELDEYNDTDCRCSACGYEFELTRPIDDRAREVILARYCPICGAEVAE